MPILISETDVKLERSDMECRVVLPREVGADGFIAVPLRRKGLHLSGLLRYCAEKSHMKDYTAQVDDEEMPLRWAIGHASEEFFVSLYPDIVWQPGEIALKTLHGKLWMNCDGISRHDRKIWIDEFKFNRAKKCTGADLLKKKWLWMRQGAGYCLAYDTDVVRWHVIAAFQFPNPVYTQYVVGFPDKELREVKNMLDNNYRGAVEEGYEE